MILEVFFGLVIILAAYLFGKQQGYKAGYAEGKACMVLELREQSHINGCCFFCGTIKNALEYHNEIVAEDSNENV